MADTTHYDIHAQQLSAQYESLTFEEVHPSLLDFLPAAGAAVLDVGAGSGRDAAWLAARGYEVVAVEPARAMREQAQRAHQARNIHWMADSLPDLAQVRRLGICFDLILLSAVWMHVPPAQRARAFRKLATLLAPNGRIAISLRLGEPDHARAMYAVSLPELAVLAQQFGLRMVHTAASDDRLGRPGISWATAIVGLPDDGLGALPLLRHLILIDNKASTYKIALLRVLARIADAASGCARHEAEHVAIPMGLVALYWMRMFKPLIEHGLPQMPASASPAFATASFHALRSISAVELRAGAVFHGQTARHLQRSLGEIARTIRDMPARYLRWPASDEPILRTSVQRPTAAPPQITIDEALLWSFGEMQVPLTIWHALTRYNVWVEPVLVTEWVRLIESYAGNMRPDVRLQAQTLLIWADPERDTRIARAAVDRLRSSGKPIYCVWSGQRLRDAFHVDHCFPFAAWPCGDAWNLMPASSKINGEKSNRLITQAALDHASERISNWWTDAFISEGEHAHRRFFLEAANSLPMVASSDQVADVLDAMKVHRIRLAKDQGLRPWEPAARAAVCVPLQNLAPVSTDC